MLERTVNDAARQFSRVLVMPNLQPPVTGVAAAIAYRQRILDALDPSLTLDPKMTLYLTDQTTRETVRDAAKDPNIVAFKWYPAGATTNSESGVTSYEKIMDCLAAMQEHGIVLCIHGEVTDAEIDIFDREAVFIERTLSRVIEDFPKLKIVFEHITTAEAVDFVETGPDNLAATITAHHLLYNRNAMLAGGIRPHYYCLPILKRSKHQQALRRVATSGNSKFFLGTDSAPHEKESKESACGCAGAYTAFTALEMYAEVFEEEGALSHLEAFCSLSGAAFYGVEKNTTTVQLKREPLTVPETLAIAGSDLVPLRAGETLGWKLQQG